MALPTGRKAGTVTSRLWLVVATVLIIHLVCYQAAAPLRRHSVTPHAPTASTLIRRSLSFEDVPASPEDGHHEPLPPTEETSSLIDYMSAWHGASAQAKPVLFTAFILWLIFLFAFVGITASDFFCPNLSTIASRLGLSESVAGVTFLAFSNGSPDVFSTFAALKSNSGSLAIGELLGAASFIVSVVAGTMCVIKPFRVSRHTFIRDVGFFTIAVSFTMGILWDNHIHLWEACAMVGLYVTYVIIVAFQSWWIGRRDRRDERIRQARSEYATEENEEFRDEEQDNPGHLSPMPSPNKARSRAQSIITQANSAMHSPNLDHYMHHHPHLHPNLEEDMLASLAERGTPVTLTRARSGSGAPPTARRAKSRSSVRPSLLGAIEFRDVVNSLHADSTARSLAVFGAAAEDHPHTSYFDNQPSLSRATSAPPATRASRSPTLSRTTSYESDGHSSCEEDQGDWGAADSEPESRLGPETPLIDLSPGVENPWRGVRDLRLEIPSSAASSNRTLRRASSASSMKPSIRLTTEEGESSTLLRENSSRFLRVVQAVFVALFPSLHDFRSKSILGKATAILCVPAILALNLTLPVVENEEDDCCESYADKDTPSPPLPYQDDDDEQERHEREAVAHRFHEGLETPWATSPHPMTPHATAPGVSDAPEADGDVQNVPVELSVNQQELTRWLTAVQCTLGPVFCTVALLSDDVKWWYPLVALGAGLLIASFAFWCFEDRRHPGRIVLCFVGFFVAMVWILMIVNEVVGVLQTIGHIFGLSDAILGLTIFAMGNSLGDLVANATVARMGFPSMAIAACFGGPMLNILLGVGLSGTYLILSGGGVPLHIDIGRTLLVSGAGLLAILVSTLIIVPLNHYWMSKRLGWSLITAYTVILSINVCVEIWL